ncbi:MAG: hypothetical protein J7L96_01095 [Bacteroidales bacterium]|nr:hypothetical protein [Bacteroidales bacterium]
MSSYLQKLEALPPEIISEFRKTHKSEAIPLKLQELILDMEAVVEIRETDKFDNISRIARELRKRRPQLGWKTALLRVYDALNFFHVNENVSNDVWDKIYTDKMEDLAKLAIAKGKEEVAYKAFLKAHEYRTKAESRIRPEDLKSPVFIISPTIKPEDLGYEKASMMEISRKANEGKYIKMIDSLPISEIEKKQIYEDAGIDIEDVTPLDDE